MFVRAVCSVYRRSLGRSLNEQRLSLFKKLFRRGEKQKEQENQKEEGKPQEKEKQEKAKEDEKEPITPFKRKLDSHTDFAQLKRRYSKHIPPTVGQAGFEEVLFWSDGAVNFEEILTLAEGFSRCWDQLPNHTPPQSYQFEEFKNKAVSMAALCNGLHDIYVLSRFGRMYGLDNADFWANLEEKYCLKVGSSQMNQQELSLAIGVFMNFAVAQRGEEVYYRVEQLIHFFEKSLTMEDVSRLLAGLHSVKKGSPQTIVKLVAIFLTKLGQTNKECVVLVTPVLQFIQGINQDTFQKLQEHILQKGFIEDMNHYELGEVAKGFGHERGSDEFWRAMQNRLNKLQLKVEDIEPVVFGFLSSYRCSDKVAQKVAPLIRTNISSIHPRVLSQASKDFYMYELNDKQLFQEIEGTIVQWLRDYTQIDLQDLLLVTKNYCLTRHGTRAVYRMLEEVIMNRIHDIKMDRPLLESFMTIYENSDLCSLDLRNVFLILSH